MRLTRALRRPRNDGGYALAMTAILLFVMLLMAGFAVDLGNWFANASKVQRAADAAALAGASSMPDEAEARAQATAILKANGFVDGSNAVDISTSVNNDQFVVSVTDTDVRTFFVKLLVPSFTISRDAAALKGSRSPALGSPYNVFGTGDLDIPGIPRQNFWLAINGMCDAKEDGDYFNARYDANKGPWLNTQDSKRNFRFPANARHHCPPSGGIGVPNPDHTNNGYSYFVDIPPTSVGGVHIMAYDAAFDGARNGAIDRKMEMGTDFGSSVDTQFLVFDTHGTPDDDTDDGQPVGGKIVSSYDRRPNTSGGWIDLFVADHLAVVDGAQYRVQVVPYNVENDANEPGLHGINAFGLGAFVNGVVKGCDTRDEPTACTRVYGRNAISTYNNLDAAGVKKVTYYFADIDRSFVGTTMKVHLWDPGEGVEKLELVGPDGSPFTFDWTTDPFYSGYNGTKVDHIDTSGVGPLAQPNLSNDYKFNDRLVTLTFKVPEEYVDMIRNANGRTGVQIRYTVNDAPSDRTTWGLTLEDYNVAPVRLITD